MPREIRKFIECICGGQVEVVYLLSHDKIKAICPKCRSFLEYDTLTKVITVDPNTKED